MTLTADLVDDIFTAAPDLASYLSEALGNDPDAQIVIKMICDGPKAVVIDICDHDGRWIYNADEDHNFVAWLMDDDGGASALPLIYDLLDGVQGDRFKITTRRMDAGNIDVVFSHSSPGEAQDYCPPIEAMLEIPDDDETLWLD